MLWRLPGGQFAQGRGAGNRDRQRKAVLQGPAPGLLAYRDGRPVGWCALAPRTAYSRIMRSPMVKGDRDEPGVWSVPCFYVARDSRRTGVASALIEAAVRYAADHGARALEGYPVPAEGGRVVAPDAFTGTVGLFASAGFREQPSGTRRRRVMRRDLG
jgi:GNAT superfamily N-acetyltransferase